MNVAKRLEAALSVAKFPNFDITRVVSRTFDFSLNSAVVIELRPKITLKIALAISEYEWAAQNEEQLSNLIESRITTAKQTAQIKFEELNKFLEGMS